VGLLYFPVSAQTSKEIVAVKVNPSPNIDGVLDDECWHRATPISDFFQRDPREGEPSTEKTEVRIVYDDDRLYIGISCFDSEASKIIANELRRDGVLDNDDVVGIVLDTFHDHRSGFQFAINPNGARYDGLITDDGNGQNRDWNGVWDVRTTVTSDGWFAEIEIPFSTLRFSEDNNQVWGFNVQRSIRRKNEQTLWSGWSRNYRLANISKAGTLTGLSRVRRGNQLEVKPYVSAGFQRGFAPFSEERTALTKTGVDLKYAITPTLTTDITLNTDFAQVEADRAVINLTRFPVFFPEKREFFLEGAGVFDVNFGERPRVFYSRQIGIANGQQIPIIAGARLIGKAENYDLGFIEMQTARSDTVPSTNFAVARVKRDILDQSYIGVILTDKEQGRHYNRVLAGDFNLRFTNVIGTNTLEIGGAIAGSQTPNLSGDNLAYRFFIDFPNDFIDHFIGMRNVQRNFNAETGFVSRYGRQVSWALRVAPRPEAWGIRRLNFKPIDVEYYWDENDVPISSFWEWRPLGFTTESGEDFEFNIQRTFDRLDDAFNIFGTDTIPKGAYWFTHYELQLSTNPSRSLSGEAEYNWGDYYNGSARVLFASATAKVDKHLSLSADFERHDVILLQGPFTTNQIGGRLNYAFSTHLATAVFAQWNNEDKLINLNFRLNWIPQIGSDVYLVYNQLFDATGKILPSQATILTKIAYRFAL